MKSFWLNTLNGNSFIIPLVTTSLENKIYQVVLRIISRIEEEGTGKAKRLVAGRLQAHFIGSPIDQSAHDYL